MKRAVAFHVPTLIVSNCLEHCVGKNSRLKWAHWGQHHDQLAMSTVNISGENWDK